MDIEVLKSYLVDLGFEVNQPELRKFELALKDAAQAVESHTSGIVADVLKWQTALVGAFVAVSSGVVAMADHVAMADQKFRLLGLRMHMSTEAARKMQLGLDALGASLEEVMWDPELNAHFLQLAEDQDRMAKALGANFEANMRSLRDLRFEFLRLKVAFEYLSMNFINSLFERFGLTVQTATEKLDHFVTSFEANLPGLSSKLADVFVPILKDTWDILKGVGSALAEVGTAFMNVIGALTGDSSIDGVTFSFEKFGAAVVHVADFLADCANLVSWLVKQVALLTSGLSLLFSGQWKKANDVGSQLFTGLPELEELKRKGSAATGPASDKIAAEAQRQGIDPDLAKAVAMQESGMRQRDANGNLIMGAGTSATGVFQLTRAAAQDQGVDATDESQNIRGGVGMIRQLLARYQGNQARALAAYYWGSGNVDAALRGYKQWSPEALNYVRGVESKEGLQVSIGDINVQLMQPGATHAEIAHATEKGVTDALAKHNARTRRQIAELGFAG